MTKDRCSQENLAKRILGSTLARFGNLGIHSYFALRLFLPIRLLFIPISPS